MRILGLGFYALKYELKYGLFRKKRMFENFDIELKNYLKLLKLKRLFFKFEKCLFYRLTNIVGNFATVYDKLTIKTIIRFKPYYIF